MADYRISGVWKSNGVITHYAMHDVTDVAKHTISLAKKVAKAEAIKIVETTGNAVYTIVWSYDKCIWKWGEQVTVVGSGTDKYLRSNPDNKVTDNLDNLPNYSFIY